ncbi:MAG: hypothetical protein WBL63_11670, partial [Candidatus Acidiferrum sp.]
MNRREWLKVTGVTGIATTLPLSTLPESANGTQETPQVNVDLKRLNLRHTWTTTMSSSAYRETVNVRYTRAGVTGYGEGA